MIQLFHWMGAALLPLCGWLTGTALQAGKEQHILQLRHTVELLRRIRQEVAYRRPDMELLCRCLIQEGLLTPAEKLQALAPPASFRAEERFALNNAFPASASAKLRRSVNGWTTIPRALKRFCSRLSRKQPPVLACPAGWGLRQELFWH